MDIQGLLDSFFLTRQNPVTGMLTTDEQEKLRTQQAIGTGIGVATGLASNWNKGPVGAVLGAYTGGVGGRQAPVDTALKNYMTTSELTKMMQDIKLGQYNLKDKERFEAGLADAIKRDPSLANSYFVDPKGTLERFQKTQEKFRPLPEYDKQDLNIMGQLGIDRQNMTAQDFEDLNLAKDTISSLEKAKLAVSRAEFKSKNTLVPLDDLPSANSVISQIKASRAKRLSQPTDVQTQTQPAQAQVQPTQTQPAQVQQQPKPAAVNTTQVPQTNTTATPSAKTVSNVPFVKRPNVSPVARQQLLDNQGEIQKRLTDSFTSLNKFEQTVYDIITDKDFDNAFGPLATKRADIEGTAAFKINNLIKSTEGAALVNELKALKSLSPQGSAGTGQLSEKEGERIIKSLNKIQLGLPPEEGKRVVLELLQTIQTAKSNINQGYTNDYGNDFEFPKSQFLPLETKVKTDKGEVKVYSGANPYIKKRFPAKAAGLDPNAQYYIMNNELYYF
jgi:hypothetical protein